MPAVTAHAGGQVTIDLSALVANYVMLQALAAPARAAAVVKANAYGLGLEPVARALMAAGCERFFVAHFGEGLALRQCAPDAEIYVLNGFWPESERPAVEAGLIPVLNSLEQVERWQALAKTLGQPLPAIIQIDSGMARLGLSDDEVDRLAARPEIFIDLEIRYLLSHLACADTPEDPVNGVQLEILLAQAAKLAPTPLTLANSAAILAGLGRGDLVRCGLGLYGAAPIPAEGNPMRAVVQVHGRVLQQRFVPAGAGVGYGLTGRSAQARRIATISIGYGDGWPRALSGVGAVFFEGVRLPIVGRISMDSLMVDASPLAPDVLKTGDQVEFLGPHQTLEAVAGQAGTISYEVLTNLGPRLARTYLPAEG